MGRKRTETANFWLPEALSGCALLHARFHTHRYALHTHDDYGIGLVVDGAHRIGCNGARWVAPPRSFVVVNPGDPHDGGAGTETGYTFRVFYLPVQSLGNAIAVDLDHPPATPRLIGPVVADLALDDAFTVIHRLCDPQTSDGADALEIQSRMTVALATLVRRHGAEPPPPRPVGAETVRMARARAWLLDHLDRNVSLDELARVTDLGRFQLVRQFRAATGLPPHAWLTVARIARARDLLRQGIAVAEVAAAVGFFDQAHLHRHFLAHTGITPGQYQAATLSQERAINAASDALR